MISFKKKLSLIIPYFIFFIASAFLVLDAGIYRHWTSVLDMDLMLIYNTLTLRSDMYNEYVDHPGYSTMLALSLWLDFLNIVGFNNISDLYELQKHPDLKNQFQNLFIYSRILNIFLIFIFITFIFKILNFINKNKIGNIFLALAFTFSFSLIEIAGQLRTELLSCACLFALFYFLLKFINNNSKFRFYLFFSGIVFVLGMFSKMQFFFVVVFFPLILFYFFKPSQNLDLKFYFFENKKIILLSNILFLVVIILIWERYSQGFINKLFIPLILFYFTGVCIFFKSYYSIPFKALNAYLVYFFGGQGLTMIFFYFYKKFNLWNAIVLVNMPGWLTRYVEKKESIDVFNPNFYDYVVLFKNHINKLFIFLNRYFLDFFTFENTILFAYIFFLFRVLLKNKLSVNLFIKFFSYLGVFLFISFIFSFRPSPFYLIFITPLLLIGLILAVSSEAYFNVKKNYIWFSFFILFFSLINFNDRKVYKTDDWNYGCKDPISWSRVWLTKMNPDTYEKLCSFKVN